MGRLYTLVDFSNFWEPSRESSPQGRGRFTQGSHTSLLHYLPVGGSTNKAGVREEHLTLDSSRGGAIFSNLDTGDKNCLCD